MKLAVVSVGVALLVLVVAWAFAASRVRELNQDYEWAEEEAEEGLTPPPM